jgi:hypothetical protein
MHGGEALEREAEQDVVGDAHSLNSEIDHLWAG